jgi:GAF domain-containing protein
MLDISRRLAGASSLNEVYDALVQTVMVTGADRCTMYTCEELDNNNLPIYAQAVFIRDRYAPVNDSAYIRFSIKDYETLVDLIRSQETLVVENIKTDALLSPAERTLFTEFGARSLVINPLVTRTYVIGLLSIEYRELHSFSERELALYRTLCNQTTIAIEHARQLQRTADALAETQTLYRAGRVLAGAADLQEILQESLVEFVYSLGLDQGGVTLLSPDRQLGQLMAYLEHGQLQDIERLKFPIQENIPYQQELLGGRPFVSYDVPHDPDLAEFRSFNTTETIKSTLQAPMIIRGETVGWIGADAVREHREFTQREVDLARAMADQIAITIQNRRLLEQTELRADRLKAVAKVGEAVTGLTHLDEILNLTVDLIRDRFKFYHVSIFLVDDAREWAVVRASTGEVGKIMVARPHRLGVGSNSIVGFVTANAVPRVALDVGEDKVHFENPLLRDTRSEMALPLISRGVVIGALDVQSVDANAFTEEDVETLQIMANQLTAAIENARREAERERLIEETRQTLERTQTLYRISDTLAAATDLRSTFETVLGEYLRLLGLKQGSVMLYDKITNANRAQARYIDGQPVEPVLAIPPEQDLIFQHMQKEPRPLVIDNPTTHPLTHEHISERGRHNLTGMLFVPLMIQDELSGNLVLDATEGYKFNQNDLEIGEAIADQLNIWLENRQLLAEAQYRSDRLQTAAEVSRAASSILDIDQLIQTSVNLIRDQFNFYYVGLFLVDDTQEWAVLKAGTGEAGRIQLEKEHKLKIGGESMIGWSTVNRKARIALDVGEEGVRFQNPYLPDTHSEMALPLIALDKVIGALTVQSVERRAFSDEDITLLQTMADQLANAIENANLFSQTQAALAETEKLYRMAQELSSARDEQSVYEIAMEAISGTGIDASTIYAYVTPPSTSPLWDAGGRGPEGGVLEQKAVWTSNSVTLFPNGTRFKASELILEDLIPSHGSLHIEDIDNDPHLTGQLRNLLKAAGYVSLLAMPLSTHQQRLGFLLAAYKTKNRKFTKNHLRFFTTTAQQMVIALENLRLLDASQRRLRREEIIREISSKIRNATEIEDILKTTVTELGKVLGTSKGHIRLGAGSPATQAQLSVASPHSGPPPAGYSPAVQNLLAGNSEGAEGGAEGSNHVQ